jgi:hypothetical protein
MLRFPFCAVRIKAVIYLSRRTGKEIDLPITRQSDSDGLDFPLSWFQRKASSASLVVG